MSITSHQPPPANHPAHFDPAAIYAEANAGVVDIISRATTTTPSGPFGLRAGRRPPTPERDSTRTVTSSPSDHVVALRIQP
jgi:hypothetical protein